MYTLKHPYAGATLLRRYSNIADAAIDAMNIFNDIGIFYLIVEAK